ncbi:MAG: hypothetical protein ACREXP_13585 [Steroidobacteraceae bacterium]
MTLEDFDRILEEGFAFLISEFNYSSQPARGGGGRFGSGFHKAFTRDRQTIEMLIGDWDSQLFCNVVFSDGDDAQVEPSRRHYRQRTLYFLLKRQGVDSIIPTREAWTAMRRRRTPWLRMGISLKSTPLTL